MTTLIAEPTAKRPAKALPRLKSIEGIIEAAEIHGSYFFSPSTMAAFRSEVDDEVWESEDHGTYFITSEQQSGDFWRTTGMGADMRAMGSTDQELEYEYPRTWTVRRANLSWRSPGTETVLSIDKIGSFEDFDNREDAAAMAAFLAYENHECTVCSGELLPRAYGSGFHHKDEAIDHNHKPARLGDEREDGDDDE
jgi:hypothetical protein